MILVWLALALASPLVDAAASGDRGAVQRLLDGGANPDATRVTSVTHRSGLFGLGKRHTTETETSAVHEAVERALSTGDVRILALLLARGADPDRRTATYPPPLHQVAAALGAAGAKRTTEALLVGGADPTGVFRHQAVTAAVPPEVDAGWFVARLLAAGADPSALLCDATGDRVVVALLAAGADPNGACFARPPLLRAAMTGSEAAIDRLLDAGADPNGVGVVEGRPMAPLHVAAAAGWVEGIRRLVERGADPNRPAGLLGGAPLAVAGSREVALALAERGATRSVTHPDHGPGVWFARAVDPAEFGAVLASWVEDEHVVLPEVLEALAGDALRARVAALGAVRFERLAAGLSVEQLGRAFGFAWGPGCALDPAEPPVTSTLKDLLGRPADREVGPATVRLRWEEASAEVWRRGYGRGAVWVQGVCPSGGEGLVGLPRSAVWLALGEPAHPGPALDRWEGGVFVTYEGDVAVGWGQRW